MQSSEASLGSNLGRYPPGSDSLSMKSTYSRVSSVRSWFNSQWNTPPLPEEFVPPNILPRLASNIVDCVDVERHELRPNDFIIAVMGPTGAGKSTLISRAIGRDRGVGSTLQSFTSQVSAIRIVFGDGINIVLVDTPGFDDTFLSDLDILKLISDWLRGRGKTRFQLTGLLYLHRISDNRMGGTPLKNLTMFQSLCGKDRFDKVILTTTMWSKDEDALESDREEELKTTYWSSMIKMGSGVQRFDDTSESAWAIINDLVRGRRQYIQVQRELDPDWKDVPDTAAGRQLHDIVGALVNQQQEVLRRVQVEMLKTRDPRVLEALLQEYTEIGQKREKAMREMQELNPSMFSRIYRRIKKQRIPFPYQERCEALFLGILQKQDLQNRVASLNEGPANEMAVFVDKFICEKGIPASDEPMAFLFLQSLIVKAKQYPTSFRLQQGTIHVPIGRSQGIYNGTIVRVKVVAKRCATVKEILSSVYSFQENILPLYNLSSLNDRWDRFVFPQNLTILPYFALRRKQGQAVGYDKRIILISDVLEGLSYLHRLNIIHGSLRATNVFVCRNGRALIAASNLVAAEDRNTYFPARWAAPEILDEPSRRTFESDIWSFGCLCYEILTEVTPFYEYKRTVSVVAALRYGNLPTRPAEDIDIIDEEMWHLMSRCWAPNPTQRPNCYDLRSSFPHQTIIDEDSRPQDTDPLRQKLIQLRSSVDVNYENIYNLILYLLRVDVKSSY